MSEPADFLRIDRWLYCCRFYKTRGQAQTAVAGGHVRVNGERTTPGSRVKCGDRIELVRERLNYSIDVVGIPTRRGPATEVRRFYVEDPDSVRQREEQIAALKQDRQLMPRTGGKPDKRTRRKLIERNRD